MAKQREVEVVQGTGKLTGPRELAVEGDGGARKITFESAILAAGSRVSRIPGIPYDDPRVWDSTAALELREIPERLLVIGGGIIGLELATVYDALGAKVTVVELLDRLMTGTDADLVKVLERHVRRRYEAILVGTKVEKVEAGADGLTATLRGSASKDKEPLPERFDILVAGIGRRPSGDSIGVDTAGVKILERGFISGRPPAAHQRGAHLRDRRPGRGADARAQGVAPGQDRGRSRGGGKSAFDVVAVPAVAYTDPEIAWVGLTEEQAALENRKVETGTFPWLASAFARAGA